MYLPLSGGVERLCVVFSFGPYMYKLVVGRASLIILIFKMLLKFSLKNSYYTPRIWEGFFSFLFTFCYCVIL